MQHDLMSPPITLGNDELGRLRVLAMSSLGHAAGDSDYIHYELERAHVVPDADVPADVARVGSTVTYRCTQTGVRTVRLAYPDASDFDTYAISVFSPVGAALLGLKPGQTITRTDSGCVTHELAVLSVRPPEPGP